MPLLVHRPTGLELKPKLVGMIEIAITAVLFGSIGTLTGFGSHQLGVSRDYSVIAGMAAILPAMLIYGIVRSRLVRKGWVHPVAFTPEDGEHKDCPCES